eukprot:1604345-Pyramimonas_sp.AAC.1
MMKRPPWTTLICLHTSPKSSKLSGYFLGHQKHKRRWRRFMKKPVKRVRRMARRTLKGRGKGRSKGKGKRRRLHGRGIPAFLASLTGPQHEDML